MDNVYILMLIIKKHINVGNFITWYNCFTYGNENYATYDDYMKEFNSFCENQFNSANRFYDLGDFVFTEFEFKYFVSFLSLRGDLHE